METFSLEELANAETELANATALLENSSITFGAAIQHLERIMRDVLKDDPSSLAELETTCRVLLELPKLAINYSRQVKGSFGVAANAVRDFLL